MKCDVESVVIMARELKRLTKCRIGPSFLEQIKSADKTFLKKNKINSGFVY